MSVASAVLVALAIVGLANAAYFTLVTYRVLPPDPRWLPQICRMDERTCASIIHTDEARLLGLPNAVYGLAWYTLVLVAGVWATATGGLPFCLLLLVAAAVTVAISLHLARVLLVRLRTPCPLCFLGHGVNAAILVTLVVVCGT